MNSVLVYNQFDFETLKWLEGQSFLDVQHASYLKADSTAKSDAQAVIIRSSTKVDEYFLSQHPKLELIVTTTSGFDHIDLSATQKRKIKVCFTPDANAQSAAELTWALVLACTKNLIPAHTQVKAGFWNRQELTGIQLGGLTYGVIGFGRVGSRVARVAKAFGMNVLAYDPYQSDEIFEEIGVERLGFEEVVKTADILSLHVPNTNETNHMFDLSTLEYVKRGAILVNTARGSVINEAHLAKALENNWIRAVGLDVFSKEPLSRQSALIRHKNVVFTPHIGARTEQALSQASREGAKKVIEYFLHQKTSDLLPIEAPWADDTSC